MGLQFEDLNPKSSAQVDSASSRQQALSGGPSSEPKSRILAVSHESHFRGPALFRPVLPAPTFFASFLTTCHLSLGWSEEICCSFGSNLGPTPQIQPQQNWEKRKQHQASWFQCRLGVLAVLVRLTKNPGESKAREFQE